MIADREGNREFGRKSDGDTADVLAIHALNRAYAEASSNGDCAAWLACWTADGVWDAPFGTFAGNDARRAQWPRLWRRIAAMTFAAEVIAIKVDGDRATAQVRCEERVTWKDGTVQTYAALYDDAMRREPEGWKFARRTYALLDTAADPRC